MNAVVAPSASPPLPFALDAVPPQQVAPGCWRRDLPGSPGLRVRVIELAPGAQWPRALPLETGASVYVIDGELIDGDVRHAAGTYLRFAPDSRLRPRTERGVRLLETHASVPAFLAAGGSPDAIAHYFHPTEG